MKNKKNLSSNTRLLSSESGQAIVFIVGALATAFIFGVLASYLATTSIKKTAYTGQAEAALHAAEAGCRHVLVMDDAEIATTETNCSDEATACPSNPNCSFQLGAVGEEDRADVCFWVEELGGNSNTYVVPNPVEQDETVQIDLTGLSGRLEIYWCDTGSASGETCGGGGVSPALEAAVIYRSGSEYRLDRYAYDDDAGGRGNGFTIPGGGSTVSGIDFGFGFTISSLPSNVEFIRIKPLYNDGNPITIAAVAQSNFPSQGLDIRCQGTVGESTRTVQVTKERPYLSSIFDYVLFSGTVIDK